MKREEARKNAEVMAAYVEGKKIEVLCDDGEWCETDCPSFDWLHEKYRVKKEQCYRPFKDGDECFNEMKNHEPFGWVQCDETEAFSNIVDIEGKFIRINKNFIGSLDLAYEIFTFADGTPFGIKE